MKTTRLAVSLLFALAANAAAQATPDLPGLWGATRRFGPDTRGTLIIYRTPEGWRADFAGFTVPVRGDRPATFAFDLPDGKGSFGTDIGSKGAPRRRSRSYWILIVVPPLPQGEGAGG